VKEWAERSELCPLKKKVIFFFFYGFFFLGVVEAYA